MMKERGRTDLVESKGSEGDSNEERRADRVVGSRLEGALEGGEHG